MSGRGHRSQSPSGSQGLPTRTSSASRDSPTPVAGAAAVQATPRQLEECIHLANLASSVPYTLELPLYSGGEAGVPPGRAVDPQPGQGVGSQPREEASPQASRAANPQASQGVGPQWPLDIYRLNILREILTAERDARRGQRMVSASNLDIVRSTRPDFANQVQERGTYLIKDGTGRSQRHKEHFRRSYSPFIRDLMVARNYAPEITQVFRNEPDPTKRLQTFQARLNSLKGTTTDKAKLELFCEYVLVVDEESRELASAGHRETPSPSMTTMTTALGGPAEGGPARASCSAHAGPSNPSRKRNTSEKTIPESATGGGAARPSSNASPFARVADTRRATTDEDDAGAGARVSQDAGPTSGKDRRRRKKAPAPAPLSN
jgi:hypothetical protein